MKKLNSRLKIYLSNAILIFLIVLPTLTFGQTAKEITDSQKKEFIELLKTLPTKGEFYTEESVKKALPYQPVLFALTEKDVTEGYLFGLAAISSGMRRYKEQREYAAKHFAEIQHPIIKLLWGVGLFKTESVTPEIVKFLRDALDSKEQAKVLAEMIGPEFKFFKREVKAHPFANDGRPIKQSDEDEGHADWVTSVAFSPDGKKVVSGSHDGTLILWDVSTGRQLLLIDGHRLSGRPFEVLSVDYSPDGKSLLSASSDGTARLWDATTGKQIRIFSALKFVKAVAFSPDSKKIVVTNGSSLLMWDVIDGRLIHTFHTPSIYMASDVIFSPDGHTLISYSGLVQIWDVDTGKEIRRFDPEDSIFSMALSSDGKSLLLGKDFKGYLGIMELWDVRSGKLLRTFPEQPRAVKCIAISPDGKITASESQEGMDSFSKGFIKLWDMKTGKEIRRLKGHESRVSTIAFSPDGKTIISGSWDNTLKLWNVETGDEIRGFPAKTLDH